MYPKNFRKRREEAGLESVEVKRLPTGFLCCTKTGRKETGNIKRSKKPPDGDRKQIACARNFP